MPERAILAVDVDGVLNACSLGANPPRGWEDARVMGFRIRYNPGHGARLLAIAEETGAELTWCTTWEENANAHIRQLVGLPELPVVPMEPSGGWSDRSVGETKAMALRIYAAVRPFCWLDDEPDAARELAGCPAPCVVVEVDSRSGLQEHHFKKAQAWLAALPGAVSA